MSNWQHVQNIFHAVADLPAGEQQRMLHELCAGDTELQHEVQSLLDADCESAMTIDSAIQGVAGALLDPPAEAGQRFGVYRIVREIGRGGMGSVYLAVRDDEEYTREVALKVVKRGLNNEEMLRRFRDERQILANLDHPYIARLFDGGSTPQGVPFFVMEHVEGRPIDVYCREENLTIKQRCALFLRVLEAVACAHRNLVVHGDLKPANIFVTSNGTPKLLDFGVAELLGEDERVPGSARRAFTPGYASPEQVRGLPVTTGTDIYSLGAVLYELLSGVRAQPVDFDTPTRIERAVCREEVSRPPLAARGVPQDLECVVFKALNKEPEHRYASASQFAEDIQRALERRPVVAREHTLGYRAGRFVMRNVLSVALGVLVAIALIGGLAVSLMQTHRARQERAAADAQRQIALRERAEADAARDAETKQRAFADQQRKVADEQRAFAETERDEAQKQKATADQRLGDLMGLMGHTLFDIHATIAALPGSLQARRQIVQSTLDYLKTFEEKPTNDQIREALAAAYYKVSLIQADPHGPSLGEPEHAEESLRKGEALLMPAYNRNPNDPGLILRLIELRSGLSDLMYRTGREQQAVEMNLELLPTSRRLVKVSDKPVLARTQEIALENTLVGELISVDPQRAVEHSNHAADLAESLLHDFPDNLTVKQAYAATQAATGGANKTAGKLEQAAENYRRAITVREDLLRADPNNLVLRRNLTIVCGNYSSLLGVPWSANLGRPEEARKYAARAVELARWMVNADPKDTSARRDLAYSLGREGMIDPAPGQAAESLALLEEAEKLIEPMMRANAKSTDAAIEFSSILEYKAHRLEALHRTDEAKQMYRKSMAALEPFANIPTGAALPQLIADYEGLAMLQASLGEKSEALENANTAIEMAKKSVQIAHSSEPRVAALGAAWSALGVVQSRTGNPELAQQSAEKALGIWQGVHRPGLLTAYREAVAEAHALSGGGGGAPRKTVETSEKYFFARQ